MSASDSEGHPNAGSLGAERLLALHDKADSIEVSRPRILLGSAFVVLGLVEGVGIAISARYSEWPLLPVFVGLGAVFMLGDLLKLYRKRRLKLEIAHTLEDPRNATPPELP